MQTISVAGRRHALMKERPEVGSEFRVPWTGICVFVAFLALAYGSVLASNRAIESGNPQLISWIAYGWMGMTFLPFLVLGVVVRFRRRQGVRLAPRRLIPAPSNGAWQSVAIRVSYSDQIMYTDLGHLEVTRETVRFIGDRCGFELCERDWTRVVKDRLGLKIEIPKVGKVPRMTIRVAPITLRDGYIFPSDDQTEPLRRRIESLLPSSRASTLPPILLLKRPLDKLGIKLAVDTGVAIGLAVAPVFLLSRAMPSPPPPAVMLVISPLVFGACGGLLAVIPHFSAIGWNASVHRWTDKDPSSANPLE